MFEYKGTEDFDIGAGYGKYEYDFFLINSEDDFWTLINHYRSIFKRFDYFLDRYETIKDNTGLSSVVQAKMKEHNANLCLSLLEEETFKSKVIIKKMVVNELTPDGIYNTYPFFFYHFAAQDAKNYYEQGLAYAKSNLHNAAIRYFSKSRLFWEYSGKVQKMVKSRDENNRIDQSLIPGHNRGADPMGNNSRREG